MRSKKLYLLSCVLTVLLILFSATNKAAEREPDQQVLLSLHGHQPQQ